MKNLLLLGGFAVLMTLFVVLGCKHASSYHYAVGSKICAQPEGVPVQLHAEIIAAFEYRGTKAYDLDVREMGLVTVSEEEVIKSEVKCDAQ